MPAELPLVPSSVALACSALLFFFPKRVRWLRGLGVLVVVAASALPPILDVFVDPARARGRALWEWSAVGGPTIEASYRVDGLAAIGVALVIAYAGAGLASAGRIEPRHPALASLILAIGLVAIAVVVTDDLVAAVVELAILAALTVLGSLAVAPLGATARTAGYLSMGLQAWILSAILISRHGSPTFDLGGIPASAVTSGALLAATVGALLFAGLYPAIAWSFDEDDVTSDPGALGSLLLMPVGVATSLLLVRLIGSSGLEPSAIAVPDLGLEGRLVAVVLILVAVAARVATSSRSPARPIAVGIAALVLVLGLPFLRWPHLVLIAAILTAGYAGVVALALPDRWESIRGDLALVAIWIAIATGSSLGIAGGVVALFARAAGALTTSLWLVPHRDYIALVGGSTVFVAGVIAVGAGAAAAGDPSVVALGIAAATLLVALELAQVGRRFRVADVPPILDAASGAAALLLAALAVVLVVPLADILRGHATRPDAIAPIHLAVILVAASGAVVLARTVRPLLGYFEMAAERSRPVMRALDPVPIAAGTFRALEEAAVRGNAAFGAFERHAGVWLATVVIVGLLVWAVR